MDVSLTCDASKGADELLNAVNKMKTQLRLVAFNMHGKAKVVEFDVYASAGDVDRFRKSQLWKDIAPEVEDPSKAGRYKPKPVSFPTSDFGFFTLHRDVVMSPCIMRAVMLVDIGVGHYHTFFGNIILEN